MGGQTSYSAAPAVGVPGQLADNGQHFIVSYVASETIPFGRFVEVSSGKVRLCQQTSSTLTGLAGVSVYDPSREQVVGGGSASYLAGELVPVLRRGQIYVGWTGTTQVDKAVPQIRHASDDTNSEAQYRGMVTDVTASTTAGQEKTAALAGIAEGVATGNSGFVLLEVNLPS